MQTQKWVNLGLLIASLALFVFLSKLTTTLWDLGRLPALESWPIEPAYLISFGLAGLAGILARRSGKANTFLNEVVVELSRVIWPARKETFASAGVVIILLFIAAVILSLIDWMWGTTIRGLLAT